MVLGTGSEGQPVLEVTGKSPIYRLLHMYDIICMCFCGMYGLLTCRLFNTIITVLSGYLSIGVRILPAHGTELLTLPRLRKRARGSWATSAQACSSSTDFTLPAFTLTFNKSTLLLLLLCVPSNLLFETNRTLTSRHRAPGDPLQ